MGVDAHEDFSRGFGARLSGRTVDDERDSRYDEIKSGPVKPIDGEAFFESLRQREEALLKKHSPQ